MKNEVVTDDDLAKAISDLRAVDPEGLSGIEVAAKHEGWSSGKLLRVIQQRLKEQKRTIQTLNTVRTPDGKISYSFTPREISTWRRYGQEHNLTESRLRQLMEMSVMQGRVV